MQSAYATRNVRYMKAVEDGNADQARMFLHEMQVLEKRINELKNKEAADAEEERKKDAEAAKEAKDKKAADAEGE